MTITLTHDDVDNSLIPLPDVFCQQAADINVLHRPDIQGPMFPIQWSERGVICELIFNQNNPKALHAGALISLNIFPPLTTAAPQGRHLQISVFRNPPPLGLVAAAEAQRRPQGPRAPRGLGLTYFKTDDYEIPEAALPRIDQVLSQFIDTVEGENQGWISKLSSYRYARMKVASLDHLAHFWTKTAGPFRDVCQTPNFDWENEVHQRQLKVYAEDICIWGGVPQLNGYADAWKVTKSAVTGCADAETPMSSGWTKVAAFASDGLPHEQTIWDSRVAVSVLGGIDEALSHLQLSKDELDIDWLKEVRIIASQAEERNERIGTLKAKGYRVGACDWPSHFGGSALVRRIAKLLKERIPFPENLPEQFGNQWNMFTVGMALFMDGK
jgi:hypothetical protein